MLNKRFLVFKAHDLYSATHKRRAVQGEIFVFFLQDTLKPASQLRLQPIDAHKQDNFSKIRVIFVYFLQKDRRDLTPSPLLVVRLS